MSFNRLREAVNAAHQGHAVAKFFSYKPYDSNGQPQPYREAIYAEVRGEMLAMGMSAWYKPKVVPDELRPIGAGEAQAMLDLMIRADMVRPNTKLYPVREWTPPPKRV